jgi:hypothetical protein
MVLPSSGFNRSILFLVAIVVVAFLSIHGDALATDPSSTSIDAGSAAPKGDVASQKVESIYYRGALSDENGVDLPDGNYTITFAFYDDAEKGTELWEETQTVRLENGEFAVALGRSRPLTLSFEQSRWLAMNIANADVQTPRTEFLIPSEEMDAR